MPRTRTLQCLRTPDLRTWAVSKAQDSTPTKASRRKPQPSIISNGPLVRWVLALSFLITTVNLGLYAMWMQACWLQGAMNSFWEGTPLTFSPWAWGGGGAAVGAPAVSLPPSLWKEPGTSPPTNNAPVSDLNFRVGGGVLPSPSATSRSCPVPAAEPRRCGRKGQQSRTSECPRSEVSFWPLALWAMPVFV